MTITLLDFIDSYEPIQNPFKESGMAIKFLNESEMNSFLSKYNQNRIWEIDEEENIFPIKHFNANKRYIITKYPWLKPNIRVILGL